MFRIALAGSLMVTWALCLSAGAQTAPAQPEELVANPQYLSWAKHAPGTTVVMEMVNSSMGQTMTMELKQVLVEAKPEEAIIELTMTMNMMGQTQTRPPMKQPVAAQVPKSQAEMTALPPGTDGTIKQLGNETIEVAGKSYDCKVHEFNGMQGQQKVNGKVWTTQEVPGTIVKMEAHSEGGQGAGDVAMTLVSVETK